MDGELIAKDELEWEHLGKLENPDYLKDDIVLAFKNPIYTPWNFRHVLEYTSIFPQNPLELESKEEAVQIVVNALNKGKVFFMRENPDYPLLRYQEYQKSLSEILQERLKEEHPYKYQTGFPAVFGKKERLESPFKKREKKEPEGKWEIDTFINYDLQLVLRDILRTVHKPKPLYSRWKCFFLIDYYARKRAFEQRAAEAAREVLEETAPTEPQEQEQEEAVVEEEDYEIFTFKAQVVDLETGDPVPDIKITVTLPDGTEEKSVTDEDGWIAFNDLEEEGTGDVFIDLEENPKILRVSEESVVEGLETGIDHVVEVEFLNLTFSLSA